MNPIHTPTNFYSHLASRCKDLSLLIVEDYDPFRVELEKLLKDFCGHVTSVEDGKKALELYKANHNYDLIITDLYMPNMDGVELIRQIRQIHPTQAIIVLSAYTDSNYLLPLINLGITHFVEKPVDHRVLLEILAKVIEEKLPRENKLIKLGKGFEWDKQYHILFKKDSPVNLTQQEHFLFTLFMANAGQILTTDFIMQSFEENQIDIKEASIRNLIFRLRTKVPPKLISSVYGRGYRLMLD